TAGPNYETRDELYADLDWAEGVLSAVWGDSIEARRGVYRKVGASGAGSWSRIGSLPIASFASAALAAKAPLDSPALTGTPTVPTAGPGTNTTQAASTAFVQVALTAALTALVNAAPGALDTLNELAAALGNDPNFATTILTAISDEVTARQAAEQSGSILRLTGSTGTAQAVTANVPAAQAHIPFAVPQPVQVLWLEDNTAADPVLTMVNGGTSLACTVKRRSGGALDPGELRGSTRYDMVLHSVSPPVLRLKGAVGPRDIAGLEDALDARAPLASPALTGNPTAPTQAPGNDSTRLATTAFVKVAVDAALAALVNAAPGALNTLDELAAALGDDPNFATTILTAVGARLSKAANLSDLTDPAAARTALQVPSVTEVALALADKADGAAFQQANAARIGEIRAAHARVLVSSDDRRGGKVEITGTVVRFPRLRVALPDTGDPVDASEGPFDITPTSGSHWEMTFSTADTTDLGEAYTYWIDLAADPKVLRQTGGLIARFGAAQIPVGWSQRGRFYNPHGLPVVYAEPPAETDPLTRLARPGLRAEALALATASLAVPDEDLGGAPWVVPAAWPLQLGGPFRQSGLVLQGADLLPDFVTGWAASQSSNGTTATLEGSGTEAGVPYVDVRIAGTSTGGEHHIGFSPFTFRTIPGRRFDAAITARVINGTAPTGGSGPGLQLLQNERDAANVSLNDVVRSAALNTTSDVTRTMTQIIDQPTARLTFFALVLVTGPGEVVDVTYRIKGLRLRQQPEVDCSYMTDSSEVVISAPAGSCPQGARIFAGHGRSFAGQPGMQTAILPAGGAARITRLSENATEGVILEPLAGTVLTWQGGPEPLREASIVLAGQSQLSLGFERGLPGAFARALRDGTWMQSALSPDLFWINGATGGSSILTAPNNWWSLAGSEGPALTAWKAAVNAAVAAGQPVPGCIFFAQGEADAAAMQAGTYAVAQLLTGIKALWAAQLAHLVSLGAVAPKIIVMQLGAWDAGDSWPVGASAVRWAWQRAIDETAEAYFGADSYDIPRAAGNVHLNGMGHLHLAYRLARAWANVMRGQTNSLGPQIVSATLRSASDFRAAVLTLPAGLHLPPGDWGDIASGPTPWGFQLLGGANLATRIPILRGVLNRAAGTITLETNTNLTAARLVLPAGFASDQRAGHTIRDAQAHGRLPGLPLRSVVTAPLAAP
ncbi:hypothetical protein, partial [Gemmobacter lutimaris]|uniref:hypothetical protein n=1 Tax=Gemmobacter lutimaris TaxID=2306023 RepID=UPI0018F6E81F